MWCVVGYGQRAREELGEGEWGERWDERVYTDNRGDIDEYEYEYEYEI